MKKIIKKIYEFILILCITTGLALLKLIVKLEKMIVCWISVLTIDILIRKSKEIKGGAKPPF